MIHPYSSQPPKAWWKQVAKAPHPLDIESWYTAKFPLAGRRIATGGSCFAQHIGARMRASGFEFIDVEPAPPILSADEAARLGYGIYSARYGNLYTARQLLQLLQRALGQFQPLADHWAAGEGFVDPFRPTIEPPHPSVEAVDVLRRDHLDRVAELFRGIDVFVFTLGLTEAWVDVRDGAVYPVAPGVSGGAFDPERHAFVNFSAGEVEEDLRRFFALARSINPAIRMVLTVSPVALAATATGDNVIVANMYSKSALRAAAGALASSDPAIDYFPSYEIITSHVMRSQFYNADMRTVSATGVDHVMSQFFSQHPPPARAAAADAVGTVTAPDARHADDIACDEDLLDALGP